MKITMKDVEREARWLREAGHTFAASMIETLARDALFYKYLREVPFYDSEIVCVENHAWIANVDGLKFLNGSVLDDAIRKALEEARPRSAEEVGEW